MTHLLWQEDKVTTAEELRSMMTEPSEAVVKKTISIIDPHAANYLSMSPLFFLATSNAAGIGDVSPRGDEAGFVKVLNEKQIAFPDRPGNRRIDSLLNVIENPQIGMIFIIPGLDEVMRVNGRASITRNAAFISSMEWNGKTSGLAVVVEVEECFIHCPRAFKQAGLWGHEQWPSKEQLPSVQDLFKAHLEINGFPVKK
ncbi:MSMEG_1061 family FMN-dependent PPOX-type flavoprotein [Paenibacillus algorifonticola]|uniref:MSMEG_1061 family FMN-dependent PPOX-type flavoprotein n=1 Tax=Paenibacillus algorifonticola TaxID=684063 RepID=UPI003D2C83BB